MHRYTLQFPAESLDESRLRDVLEREFGLLGISIIRGERDAYMPIPELPLTTPQPRNEVETLLLDCFANGKPYRRKMLIQKIPGTVPSSGIDKALMTLERNGEIRRVQHGVYISANTSESADTEIPPMNLSIERPSYEKLVAMLDEPKSAVELREALEVSRQRIDQMLKTLMHEGKVKRAEITGQRGNYVYILSEFFDEDDLLLRSPTLRSPRDRILSALSSENLYRAADLSLTCSVAAGPLHDFLEQMSAFGLITKFKLGYHTYVAITPRGMIHPQYDRVVPRCRPADLFEDYGEARVRFIQNLHVLGSARTIELTYTMPKGYFDDSAQGAGQVMQALEKAGILQRVDSEKGRYSSYSLTDNGLFLSGVFARINPPSSLEALRELIATRVRENSERMRTIGFHKIGGELAIGSHTQEAIVRALGQATQPMTTNQIILNMDTKFSNPRSVYLALHALQRRGIVRLVGVGPKKTNLWELPTERSPSGTTNRV